MRRKAKHKGLHAARLRREPEEKRFAKAWQESNDSCRTLDWLLTRAADQCRHNSPVTADAGEILTAATVVQWLGSSIGQAFLRGLGYERAPAGGGK